MFVCCRCRSYGFFKFIGDCFMICFTCGFWLVWIFVREMRKQRGHNSCCGF